MNADFWGMIFACSIAGWMLFRFIRYGGITGGLLGARIERTVGEVDAGSGKITRITLKVHALGGGKPGKAIGLEVVTKELGGLGGYESNVVALSASGARQLASLLHSATER